jgi:hypothetical protein
MVSIEDRLAFRNRRSHDSLYLMPSADLLHMLDSTLFGAGRPDTAAQAKAEEWYRFSLNLLVDVLDGWRVYVVESGAAARLLYERPTGEVREISLARGEVDDVLEQVHAQLSAWHAAEPP